MKFEFRPQEAKPAEPAERVILNGVECGKVEEWKDRFMATIVITGADLHLIGVGFAETKEAAVEAALDYLRGQANAIQSFLVELAQEDAA